MPRTTVDIEAPLLKEIKRLQKEEDLPMGKLICQLLADALARRRAAPAKKTELSWICSDMRPLVDLADKEAVYGALDRDAE